LTVKSARTEAGFVALGRKRSAVRATEAWPECRRAHGSGDGGQGINECSN